MINIEFSISKPQIRKNRCRHSILLLLPAGFKSRAVYKKLYIFLKSFLKKYNFLPMKTWKKGPKELLRIHNWIFCQLIRAAHMAKNWFPILEIRLRHPLFFLLCDQNHLKVLDLYLTTAQSHYIEVTQEDIFIEQKMIFGLVLGLLAIPKKIGGRLWATF
jgi:hypothetical protein